MMDARLPAARTALRAAFPSLPEDAIATGARNMLAAGYGVRIVTSRSKYGFADAELGQSIVVPKADEEKLRKAWDNARKKLTGFMFNGCRDGDSFHFIRVR